LLGDDNKVRSKSKPGAPVKGYFLAMVKRGTEQAFAEKLGRIEGVTEVIVAYGLWDVVARVETESFGKLDAVVADIRKMNEIKQNSTLAGTLVGILNILKAFRSNTYYLHGPKYVLDLFTSLNVAVVVGVLFFARRGTGKSKFIEFKSATANKLGSL
jgi:hypothetical protein